MSFTVIRLDCLRRGMLPPPIPFKIDRVPRHRNDQPSPRPDLSGTYWNACPGPRETRNDISTTLRAILVDHQQSGIEDLMPWHFNQLSSLAA